MRDYSEIKVERGAVHVVAPRAAHLRLSEVNLRLTDGVDEFLAGHVQRGLADPQAKAAHFVTTGRGRASDMCERLLRSGRNFIEHTGELALLLYNVSKNDARVSDGSFAVLRCTAGDIRFVAMLKLDPSDQYRTVEGVDEHGQALNQFELQPGILPAVRERLLKAVFVRSVGSDDYDMLVVDRQRPGEVVSRFFIQDFLGAEPVFDDKERTVAVYRTLTHVKNEIAPELEPIQLERLERFINGQVAADHVNLDELVVGLPVNETQRERFAQTLGEVLPDRDFDIDPNTAASLLKQRRFAADNGLLLSVRSDYFNDMVTVQQPGRDGRWTITIRTREWREK